MLNKEIIGDDKQVMLEILNGNEIKVSTNNCSVDIDANGVVREVTFSNVVSYKLNEKLAVDINGVKHNYNITKITKISDTSFLISHTIPTETKYFLLPTLGDYKQDFSFDDLLINCYLKKGATNCIVLLYRFIPGTQFNLLDKSLKEHGLFVSLSNPSYTTVAYEMEIPVQYQKDVSIFLKGKYSELSTRLKERILAFHHYNRYGNMAKVLYKNSEYRKQLEIDLGGNLPKDAELHPIPNLERELYQPTPV